MTPALLSNSKEAKTYVIVCRSNDAASIELPQSAMAKTSRLRLLSTVSHGEVNLQYVLAVEGSDRAAGDAALAGQRRLGLGQTGLGATGHERVPGQRRRRCLGPAGQVKTEVNRRRGENRGVNSLGNAFVAMCCWVGRNGVGRRAAGRVCPKRPEG